METDLLNKKVKITTFHDGKNGYHCFDKGDEVKIVEIDSHDHNNPYLATGNGATWWIADRDFELIDKK